MSNDVNRTQLLSLDPNRTMMGVAPSIERTVTIKPLQCPVCKTFNPVGMMFCVECGLIFDTALEGDAFGAPAVQLPVLVDKDGREYPLGPGENIVGRTGMISIEDGRISRRHAKLMLDGDHASIEDLGSTNGTKLNGVKLSPQVANEIEHGAVISLGGFELTLQIPGVLNKTATIPSTKTQTLAASPTVTNAVAFLVGPENKYSLVLGDNPLGRKAENSIVIPDPYVSGKHAMIVVSDQSVEIEDLGSSNGTSVNGVKLEAHQRVTVYPGDTVRIGDLELVLETAQQS